VLNIFGSLTCPGLDNLNLYHDDTDPNTFYMAPGAPRFATGSDGKPMVSLIVIARDFYLFKDKSADLNSQETELGIFNMTTSLDVTADDRAKIRSYLASLTNYYRPSFRAGRVFCEYVPSHPNPDQIVLAFPQWTTPAKVAFSIGGAGAGDTFIKVEKGSDAPSLITSNQANYQATLGQEGVELMRKALTQGFSNASVWYTVSFVARLPAINITISGDASSVYKDIKDYCQRTEDYSGDKGNWHWSYPVISGLDQLKTVSAHLNIVYDDNDFTSATAGAPVGEDVQKTISDFVFQTAQTYIQNTFFAPPFAPGVPTGELGTDPLEHNPWKDPNAPPAPANQFWLKNFTQDMEGSFGFTATYNKNITVTINPSSMLEGMIGKDDFANCVIAADLTNTYFQILDVVLSITADFANDPIAAIIVHFEYKQTDEQTSEVHSHADDFKFETGAEQYRFQVVMAKAQDGTPKDSYTYSTQIVYKYSAEPVNTSPVTTNSRQLVLGYNDLSCVRVAALWGSIPTDTVSRVQVHFEYPDPALTIPSKSKDIFLTPDHPNDSWFTFTGNNPSTEYTAQYTYFLTSGETLTLEPQRSSQPTCVVNAPFEDTLSVTFVPQGQFPPTQQIVVSTKYVDPGDGYAQSAVHSFAALTDTWTWQVRLHDRKQRAFQYKVDTTFQDGSSDTGTWKDGSEGTILVGEVAQKILEIDVIPALVDFQKAWKLVIVKLKYSDDANALEQDQTFEITAQNASGPFVWRLPVKDQTKKQYSYEVDAYAFDASQKIVGPQTTDNAALVLQL
jgi:hypothetical protein